MEKQFTYFEKIKDTWKLAFFATFISGLIIHIFKFTNTLPNVDSLYNFYADQNMVASGRWFLMIACGISSFFDLPWLIGFISLMYIGVTSVLMVEIFRLTNPVIIILTSCLMVSFPSLTDIMLYEFTADGYMLAMLLAVMSVYVFRIEHTDHWLRAGLSACCICLSCAIYQAYVSFAMVTAICYFMLELLDNRNSSKVYAKWIAMEALIYVCALAAYYVIWKLMLRMQAAAVGSYLGIDQLGKMNLAAMLAAVKQSVYSFGLFLLDRNIFQHGLSTYSLINILIMVVGTAGVVCAVTKSGLYRRKGELLLFAVCILILPFCCSIWLFASPGVSYTPRMYQSIVVIYIFILVLFGRWVKSSLRSVMAFLLALFVFNNAIIANICYSFTERCYQKTYATAVEMSMRIHLVDDGTAQNVVFVGLRRYWTEEDILAPGGASTLGPLRDSVKCSYITGGHLIIPFLTQYTNYEMVYYSVNDLEMPNYKPSATSPVSGKWSMQFPTLDEDAVTALAASDAVQEMGIWPAKDSVRQIGSTIVIKLSEENP